MIKILSMCDKKVEVSFEENLFNFNLEEHIDEKEEASIMAILYVLVSLTFFYGLILFSIFLYFQHTLHSIYSLFLSVNDKKLKVILDESTQLMDLISYNPFKIVDAVTHTYSNSKQEDEEDSDNEYQVFKKFKKNS